jgi:hypothetical protein
MMGYDSKKTLEENTKIIFEQEEAGDLINKYGKKMGVTLPSDLATPATPAAGTPAAGTPAAGTPAAGTPAAGTPATPEVSLSYEDTVKKLQNLLITKYKANLGKSGADGKIGKLTLDALADAIRTKFVKQPPTPTDGENKSTTPGTKDDETITPEDKPETTITPDATPAVNPGSVDDWK